MTLAELIQRVSEQTGCGRKEARKTFDATFAVLAEALTRGETVRIPDLGTFETKMRPARKCKNPRTGQPLEIPERRCVYFKACTKLKESVVGSEDVQR